MSSKSGFKLFGKKSNSNSIFRKNLSDGAGNKNKPKKFRNILEEKKRAKPVKFRNLDSEGWGLKKNNQSNRKNDEQKGPVKYRTLFDKTQETPPTPKSKTEYIDTKQINQSLNNKNNRFQQERIINDSWDCETEDEKRTTNVVIGSILYQYKDLTDEQIKIVRSAARACNQKIREDEIKRHEENEKWISENPDRHRISQDLHRLFLSSEVALHLWEDTVDEYETGQYTYREFFELVRVEIKKDWEEDSIKRLRNIKKKIKQINKLLSDEKNGKKLTKDQKEKTKKLRLFNLIKGNIEYWLSDKS